MAGAGSFHHHGPGYTICQGKAFARFPEVHPLLKSMRTPSGVWSQVP
jgi:hypothetical protein